MTTMGVAPRIVVDGPLPETRYAWHGTTGPDATESPAVTIAITKKPGENAIAVSDAVADDLAAATGVPRQRIRRHKQIRLQLPRSRPHRHDRRPSVNSPDSHRPFATPAQPAQRNYNNHTLEFFNGLLSRSDT